MEPASSESNDGSEEDASLKNVTNGKNSITLANAITEVDTAVDLFFNNQFVEAKSLTASRSDTSMYHSVGFCTLLFMEAIMTFEAKDISEAMTSIKKSIKFCNRYRRKQNIASAFGKLLGILAEAELTEEEKHAELIYAELNLFRAALTFIQDENLVSFIRGALQIRSCYQTYNSCLKISEKMEPTSSNMHFIGGVLLGCGSFNIGLSLLPPRVLALLEWIGFSADKHKGMEQLVKGYTNTNLRSSLTSLFILSYNLFVTVHLGTHDANLPQADTVLNEMLKKYPNGVFFHLYAGRLQQLKGDFKSALAYLEKASQLQTQWKQFSHICCWETMWCHAFQFDWLLAADCAALLRKESNWSKCVYTYLHAVFLIMLKSNEYRDDINDLMLEVPKLKQKLAGKSIPTEKFVARKARKFFEQGQFLMLPAHEMLYCWNGLAMLKENPEIRNKHIEVVNEALNQLQARKDGTPPNDSQFNYHDDFCLLQLLKAACLRYGDDLDRAELCFNKVKENYGGITKDHFLAPAAMSDLAWLLIEQGRNDDASECLRYTRKTYSHYSLESRIHFRMHAAQARLNEVQARPSTSRNKS